jgi:hypothetical protein
MHSLANREFSRTALSRYPRFHWLGHHRVDGTDEHKAPPEHISKIKQLRRLPGRRPDNVKTGYLPDAFNPVIIETISFLSVCFV